MGKQLDHEAIKNNIRGFEISESLELVIFFTLSLGLSDVMPV